MILGKFPRGKCSETHIFTLYYIQYNGGNCPRGNDVKGSKCPGVYDRGYVS